MRTAQLQGPGWMGPLLTTLIKVDIDGVLRNWNASLIRQVQLVHPEIEVKYPFEDFNIAASFPPRFDNRLFYLEEYPEEIYTQAEPYEGAVWFLNELLKVYPNVWLVTTQYEKTMYPTMQWVEKHLPAHDVPLVFSKEKGLVGRGQFEQTILIDDAPHNLNNQVKHGGIAYCFGQLYNTPVHDPDRLWEHFAGTCQYSVEDEPRRIMMQYKEILIALHTRLHS